MLAITMLFSFVFSGFYRGGSPTIVRETGKEIGKLVDGSTLYSTELNRMIRFIESDVYDADLGLRQGANVFNDGVIRNDLIKSGLALNIFETYFEELLPDLKGRFQKFRQDRLYQHPELKKVSVERIMSHYLPDLYEQYLQVKGQKGEIDLDSVKNLLTLYEQSESFNPRLIRQVLSFEMAQTGRRDLTATDDQLSLFRAKGVQDWFGKKFLELSALVILNGARLASQNGLYVSEEEARSHLVATGLQLANRDSKEKITRAYVERFLIQEAHRFAMAEEEMVETCRQILLFRRLLEKAMISDLADPLLMKKVNKFANVEVEVEKVQLPKSLTFHSMQDLLQFQCYLEATTDLKTRRRELGIPKEPLPIEEIMKATPELLQKKYLVDISSVSLADIARSIPLKEMWKWQLKEENFESLAAKFKMIDALKAIDEESRREALNKLRPEERQKIDEYSLKEIVKGNLEFIHSALGTVKEERKELVVPMAYAKEIFAGATREEAMHLLDGIKGIERITFDQDTYYQISVVSKSDDVELMTFEEALKQRVLEHILDRYLQARYPQIRIVYKEKFEDVNKEWKDFKEVKDLVALYVFKDLFQALEKEGNYEGISLEAPTSFYLRTRFTKELLEIKEKMEQGEELVPHLDMISFATQFAPIITKETLLKSERSTKIDLQAFEVPLNGIQGPIEPEYGQSYLYRVLNRYEKEDQGIETSTLQKLIGKIRMQDCLKQLLVTMREKETIPMILEEKETV